MQLKKIIVPKYLSFIYKIGIFLILLLPLISAPPYFHPADWGKSIAFRVVFSLLLFLFFWELVLYPEKRNEAISLLKSSRLVWVLLGLVSVFGLATIFSLDPYFSFWGSPYRGDGFFNFALFVLFGIFCFLNIKKDSWQRFWDFALLTGVLVSFVGIFQSLNLFNNFLVSYGQASGTMGSSVSMGIYLVLLPFIAFAFGLKTKGKKAIFYYFCALVFLLAINFSASRAAFLGIGMGSLFFALFYRLRKNAQESYFNKIFLLKAVIIVLFTAGIFAIFLAKDNQAIIDAMNKTPAGGIFYRVVTTVRNMSETKSFIPDTRFSAWQIGILAVKDRPVLGYGPENFSIAFDGHFDPGLNQFGKLYWWDRAHNIFLETAVNTGLLGLAIFIFLIVFIFWKLQQEKRKNSENYLIFHAIQATLVAYLVTGFFGFDNFGTFLIFYFILGFCCSYLYPIKNSPPAGHLGAQGAGMIFSGTFLISLALLVWFLWAYNLNPLIVNRNLNWADFYLSKSDCQRAFDKIEETLPRRSIIDNFVILKYVNIINNSYCMRTTDKQKTMEKRVELLRQAVKIRPHYTRSWVLLGNSLYNLSATNKSNGLKANQELKGEAKISFEKAKQLCPKCQDIFSGMIRGYLSAEEYEFARERSEECKNLFPDFSDCLWLKGITEIYFNNIEEGKNIIEEYYKLGNNPIDLSTQRELLDAYVAIKSQNQSKEYFEDLALIYQRLIEMDRSYAQYHASLAYVYFNLGKYADARKEANEILKYKPELKSFVEAFLKTLPY